MTDTARSTRCGIGIRSVAMVIDSVVWVVFLFGSLFPVALVTGQLETSAGTANASLEGGPAVAALALWLVLALSYHTLAEWRFGKTAGKYLVDIRVVSNDGGKPSLRASLVRNVLRLVDWLPMFYVVGIALVALSDRHERLGDRLAGTAVVRT
ncbi:RDD family protein [Haloarchaeobius sp. DFWS5]|uniref:RDD family protein n=1 Tax=Haloarchaeobius sp. DFWS5 TaxID=3446114 RepID=UPI003EBAE4FC